MPGSQSDIKLAQFRPEPRQQPAVKNGDAREQLLVGLPVSQRRLRLNGILTAVLEGGDGPPVVLLHGPGEYAAKWLRVIPSLIKTYRVIAPDLPGHGASEAIASLDAERVLGWLEDLIECTCPIAPAIVGQIIGGGIAARFASDRGEQIGTLVLVDSLGLNTFQPAPEFGKALMEFVSEPNEETHDRLWSRCAFDLNALRIDMGECWDRIKAYNLECAGVPQLRAAQQQLMEQFGVSAIPEAHLARIAVPTTLIWGRHDLATPLTVAQDTSRRYRWPLQVIENAADDPPLEQPEAFLEALQVALGGGTRHQSSGITAR